MTQDAYNTSRISLSFRTQNVLKCFQQCEFFRVKINLIGPKHVLGHSDITFKTFALFARKKLAFGHVQAKIAVSVVKAHLG